MSSSDPAYSSGSSTPCVDARRTTCRSISDMPRMRIVLHSHNRNRLYHGYDNVTVYWYRYDHISYSQTRTFCLTVRRPDEASSRSSPTTPPASPHGKHTISHGTTYSPRLRRGFGSYSTDSAFPPSWNTAPHRIHARSPHSGTRTSCRFHETLHAPRGCSEPTTSPPSDETPWTAGSRTHRRVHRRVCLGYNTHSDCPSRYFQVSSPVHAHTPHNQIGTSYYYSYEPPPPPPHSSLTTLTPADETQRSEGNTRHTQRSYRVS